MTSQAATEKQIKYLVSLWGVEGYQFLQRAARELGCCPKAAKKMTKQEASRLIDAARNQAD